MTPLLYKTTFHIAQMDCPCEEQMIRMALSEISTIHALEFDLGRRTLCVIHPEFSAEEIRERIASLHLSDRLLSCEKVKPGRGTSIDSSHGERNVLVAVFLVNLIFFLIEWGYGLWARSMGLEADALDMLADASVYGMALWAVGASAQRKSRVALWAGLLQLGLAIGGLAQVVYRFVAEVPLPRTEVMIVVSLLALLANSLCLVLLQRVRSKEAHIRASVIFSANDVIANIGVVVSALLVSWWQTPLPDLVVGGVVFLLIFRGAWRILSLRR